MGIFTEQTKSNKLATWERGGSWVQHGSAQIVCGSNGEKLFPLYKHPVAKVVNGDHALFILEVGMKIINVMRKGHKYDAEVYEVLNNDPLLFDFEITHILRSNGKVWYPEWPSNLEHAIAAAFEKSNIVDCIYPLYLADSNIYYNKNRDIYQWNSQERGNIKSPSSEENKDSILMENEPLSLQNQLDLSI